MRRSLLRAAAAICLASLCAGSLTGCAVLGKKHRRLLNAMDEAIQPKSLPARISLAPAMIPAGTAAVTIDAVIVNPPTQIPKAWDDVYELYWKPRDMDFLRKTLVVPLCAILTPPTFVGDWLGRSMFNTE